MAIASFILTFVLVVCTAMYTRIMHKMLVEAKALRLSQYSPQVFVTMIRDEDGLFQLLVQNVGGAAAVGLSFDFDDDLIKFRPGQAAINVFEHGVPHLVPGGKVVVELVGPQVWKEWDREYLGVNVNYKSSDGRSFQSRNKLYPHAIDSIRMHRITKTEKALEDISKSMRTIESKIAELN